VSRITLRRGTQGTATKPIPATKPVPKPKPAPEPKPKPKPKPPREAWLVVAARWLAMAVAFVAMVGFAVLLARATLTPSPASVGIAHANLHPGRSLRQYFDRYTVAGALRQVGGNLLLGVPFGVLLPVLAPKARGLLRVLITTALVMVLVELAQGAIVEGRAFDIDDVIMNTTGALLGWLLVGRLMGKAVHRPRLRRTRGAADTT
jgi:glycopeptide antibiotics resistance protein